MSQTAHTPFIFFLTFGEELPETYQIFDRQFKELGFILVPVRADQLQTLAATSEQAQLMVIASVSDAREYKFYNEKIRGMLKYLLKSKRLTFLHLSSFSKLNDSKSFSIHKNYFFLKYPLNARALAEKIVEHYFLTTSEQNLRWPGGRRATIGAGIV